MQEKPMEDYHKGNRSSRMPVTVTSTNRSARKCKNIFTGRHFISLNRHRTIFMNVMRIK